eukprot:10966397-Alexandrium_andersonii.AAC.1
MAVESGSGSGQAPESNQAAFDRHRQTAIALITKLGHRLPPNVDLDKEITPPEPVAKVVKVPSRHVVVGGSWCGMVLCCCVLSALVGDADGMSARATRAAFSFRALHAPGPRASL